MSRKWKRLFAAPGIAVERCRTTGTVGGTLDDAGVITLPGEKGQVVIAVFIKKSDLPFDKRELAIAEIARSVRDSFLFSP